MMLEWQYPRDLTHLNIIHCQVLNDWNIIYSMINNIWSLPKLTHCLLDINVIDEEYSIVPTIISSSLQSLSIKNLHCNYEELIHLFEHTPRLRYLDITIREKSTNQPLFSPLLLITTLKLTYHGPWSTMRNLLEHMPNLSYLSVKTEDIYLEGHQWEDLIINHLTKLKIFHLLMRVDSDNVQFRLKELVITYKTRFWLEEHRWYIQSHCYYQDGHAIGYLYTLPYKFDDYHIPPNICHSRSEPFSSNYTARSLYNHVSRISSISLPKYQFCNQFYNICHLTIELPFNDNFWIIIPTFHQLRVLDLSLSYTEPYNTDASYQLQTILERAPKLHSLIFKSSINALLPLLESTSASVIKLDFHGCESYFNYSDCCTLFLSLLGKQCQILSLKVEDRINILQLLQEMPQLHSLNVECPPNKYKPNLLFPHRDELIRWLQRQLSPTCVITRDSSRPDKIQIWIR